MLSGKLVHLIETNADSITSRVIETFYQVTDRPQSSTLPHRELRQWGEILLRRLGHWLPTDDETLSRHYEIVGRKRFQEGLSLHEAVQAMFALKDSVVDFVQGQAFAKTSFELYAEEEFEHRVDKFFDVLVCDLVRGYEEAMLEATAAGAKGW